MKRLIVVAMLVAVGIAAWLLLRPRLSDKERLQAAQKALARGEFDVAILEARQISAESRRISAARLIEAEAAQKQGRLDDAVELYQQIPATASEYITACSVAGDIRLHQGRLEPAEEFWRAALATASETPFLNNRMGLLLGIEGRRWESLPYLQSLLRRGECSGQMLLMVGDVDRIVEAEKELEHYIEVAPEDAGPLLGLARIRLKRGETVEAERMLELVRRRKPQWVEVWVQLGLLSVERDTAAYSAWLTGAARCPEIEEHPGYWLIRARWEERGERLETRARCLWEAARRHPNSVAAHYQLGHALKRLRREQEAEPFFVRASNLERFAAQLNTIYDDPVPTAMMEAARQLEALGRPWEAWAWTRAAYQADPRAFTHFEKAIGEMERVLGEGQPAINVAEFCPAERLDLSGLPLPLPPDSIAIQPVAATPGTNPFRFTDDAAAAGISFTYFNSSDPATEGMRMFEFTGGGIGAADYDRDGWPDLYLTQGIPFPAAEHPGVQRSTDELYRNNGTGHFSSVTAASGLVEADYGQGVAWGDLNNDGFDDLYVGNIGRNRLWLNNGDGTFADVTGSLSDSGGEAWTTSVLMADLDGDTAPDLYAANYLSGKDVYTRLCQNEGLPRACSPTHFESAPDSFHRASGDGRWTVRTQEAHLRAENGKGLGLLAADLDDDQRLDLFVANDAVPNFFFVRNADANPATFSERAFECGLAVDGDGKPQACMGVAADDFDGNGLVDLFVTNFYLESNTLYLNLGSLLFRDGTAESGLREPGFHMLGFGSQAFDADLDGAADLVVTNGHVDDFRYLGIPFRMRPQFYRNAGTGHFREIPRKSLGEYFEKDVLGRGLALVDWNRDGREDFAVSHLDSPASLVTNRTEPFGGFLTIQLVGTTSPRLPFGARVQIESGGKVRTRQLTAGGGYQASNSARLVFGLGNAEETASVRITWPSGQVDEVLAEVGTELVIVEGASRGYATLRP